MLTSSILITISTGYLFNIFVPMTLAKSNPCRLVIYLCAEIKEWGISAQARKKQVRDHTGTAK
jgi:hypothetical protein